MTLQGILTAIGQMAIQDRLIGFAGAGGSIYEINDLTIKNYPILYISPTGTHRVGDNFTTYALTLFYIDRLAEDNSNSVAIHSTAIEVLKNLIRKIRGIEGVVDVSDEYTISLFTEQEKFKDRCNGAYATLEVTLVNDTLCAIYTTETPEEGYYFYFKNKQGESLPYDSTKNTVAWDTDCPSIRYEILRSGVFVGGGITSGGTATIFFEENSETTPIGFEFNAYDNETGDKLSRLFWSQQAAPEEYFNFDNQDWEVLESGTTAYTLSWETNITEGVDYVVVDGNGNEVASGHTTDNSLTIYFPENTGSTDERYTIYVTDKNGNVVGELNWTVEGSSTTKYHFIYLTDPNILLPSATTSMTITWETDCPLIYYDYEYGYFDYDTGTMHNIEHTQGTTTEDSMTFNFPENTGNTEILMWFWAGSSEMDCLDSIQWRQRPSSGDYTDYFTDPDMTLTARPDSNEIYYFTENGSTIIRTLYGVSGCTTETHLISDTYDTYGTLLYDRYLNYDMPIGLYGDGNSEIAIPQGVTVVVGLHGFSSVYLANCERILISGLEDNEIKNLVLPSTLRTIEARAINGNVENMNIYFNGTMEKWGKIRKAQNWIRNPREGQVVHCVDGDVAV